MIREASSVITEATVTFLLTDIQGSTRHWEQSPDQMRGALELHDLVISETVVSHGGRVLTTHGEGDSFFAVFPLAEQAIAAACAIQQRLAAQRWPEEARLKVRVALHSGEAGGDYRGRAANRCARLRACGHGGQVLLSAATAELVQQSLPPGVRLQDLGKHRLRDLARQERIFQLVIPGLPSSFPPLKALTTAVHARLDVLEQVRSNWLETGLRQSLDRVARIEIGLAERYGAVDSSLRMVVRPRDQPDRHIEPGLPIAAVYRQLGRQLLILGQAGAGKTTLLLELAEQLLDEWDDPAIDPMPVVFHLSSWVVQRRPLTAWLVDELHKRYGVARRLGQEWVDGEQVIPLLDGLDEIAAEHRDACVTAINAFHQEHGQLPLVVCSRVDEYEVLSRRLNLRGAVVIPALTRTGVDRYLEEAGQALAGVRTVLAEDEQLAELVTTPLFLSIVAIAYKDQPSSSVRGAGTLGERRHRVLDDYVERMFSRTRDPTPAYPREETIGWLAWLARTLKSHAESAFYLDWMQADWLPTGTQRWLVTTGAAIGLGLIGGMVAGLLAGLSTGSLGMFLLSALLGGLVAGLVASLLAGTGWDPLSAARTDRLGRWVGRVRNGLAGQLAVGLGVGLTFELTLGRREGVPGFGFALILAILVAVGISFIHRLEKGSRAPTSAGASGRLPLQRNVLFGGLGTGLTLAAFGGLSSSSADLWLAPLANGIAGGVGVGLVAGLAAQEPDISPTDQLRWSHRSLPRTLSSGLAVGVAVGLSLELIQWLRGQRHSPGTGLIFGLGFGLVFGLVAALETGPHVTPALPGKGVRTSRHNAVVSGLSGTLVVGLGYGLYGGALVEELKGGLAEGFVFALAGGVAVAVICAAAGELGAWLVGAPILLALAGLTLALGIPLPLALTADLEGGLIVGLCVGLQRGGTAYLRHRMLRRLLQANGTAPREYVAFLEYATRLILLTRRGGGYEFVHGLLLEHFAQRAP